MLGWLPDGTMRETGEGSFKHDAVICELGVSSSEKTKQWLFCTFWWLDCASLNARLLPGHVAARIYLGRAVIAANILGYSPPHDCHLLNTICTRYSISLLHRFLFKQ